MGICAWYICDNDKANEPKITDKNFSEDKLATMTPTITSTTLPTTTSIAMVTTIDEYDIGDHTTNNDGRMANAMTMKSKMTLATIEITEDDRNKDNINKNNNN